MRMNVRIRANEERSVAASPRNPHERTDLAAAIRARRRQLGLRQEDLADLAGVSLRFVQALEGGKPTVQLDRVTAVLDTLGLRLVVERGTR
jgi:HTH-type transcriptional regulator / antitoxin HipB